MPGAFVRLAHALRHARVTPGARGVVESIDEAAIPGTVEILRAPDEIRRGAPPAPHPVLDGLRVHRHPAVFRAVLRDARIVGADPLVLTSDRRALLPSIYDREHLAGHAAMHERLPFARRWRGRHLLLLTPWSGNHFHWMLDTIPRVALLPEDDQAPVIVPPELTEDQRWSLQRVGIARERWRPYEGEHVKVDELVFPSLVGRTGNPPGWALDWLRTRLVPPPAASGRRLYVSRADAATRRVANEDELLAVLAPLGFERILPATLPLPHQLQAFAEAQVVVAPHGAGLVNLLACAPGTTVVELFDERYVNGCYYALSEALGLDYSFLVCPAAGTGDLLADPADVRDALSARGIG